MLACSLKVLHFPVMASVTVKFRVKCSLRQDPIREETSREEEKKKVAKKKRKRFMYMEGRWAQSLLDRKLECNLRHKS